MHTNFNMIFTSLHFTSIQFTTRKFPSRYDPVYPPFAALPFISLHYTFSSFSTHSHFLQFTTIITLLTLFLNVFGLQGRVPKISAGNRFQSRMIFFTKEYFPISVLCVLFLIFHSWSTLPRLLGRSILSPIAFHAFSPDYALKGAHIHAFFLRCDNVS